MTRSKEYKAYKAQIQQRNVSVSEPASLSLYRKDSQHVPILHAFLLKWSLLIIYACKYAAYTFFKLIIYKSHNLTNHLQIRYALYGASSLTLFFLGDVGSKCFDANSSKILKLCRSNQHITTFFGWLSLQEFLWFDCRLLENPFKVLFSMKFIVITHYNKLNY